MKGLEEDRVDSDHQVTMFVLLVYLNICMLSFWMTCEVKQSGEFGLQAVMFISFCFGRNVPYQLKNEIKQCNFYLT